MKTYAKVQGEKEFDWNKFLDKPKFTVKQIADARDRAGNWATCACGNQCDIIPRQTSGAPYDDSLRAAGSDFYQVFANWLDERNNGMPKFQREDKYFVQEAKEFMEVIELRSSQLIRQIKLNQKENELQTSI